MPPIASPDLTALSNSFGIVGPKIFTQHLNTFELDPFIEFRKNVTAPQKLPKLSSPLEPQPYSTNYTPSISSKVTDRELVAYQSKWDEDFVPENTRNTYLAQIADPKSEKFYEFCLKQMSKTYLSRLNDNTVYFGQRNPNGTTSADICDGFGTIIASEITAGKLTPITLGAITSANAVQKVLDFAREFPAWMRKMPVRIFCSYKTFDAYVDNYRATNGNNLFNPNKSEGYALDNMINITLVPKAFMGNSERLVAAVKGNLIAGTDVNNVTIHSSMKVDIIETRMKMPLGCQIADLEALKVSDLA